MTAISFSSPVGTTPRRTVGTSMHMRLQTRTPPARSIVVAVAANPAQVCIVETLVLAAHRRQARHAQRNHRIDLVLLLGLVQLPAARRFDNDGARDRQP